MKRAEIFSTLSEEEYQRFITIFEPMAFAENEIIVQESEVGDSAYLLLNGKVNIVKKTSRKENYIIETLDENSLSALFGEACLLDAMERSATVVAVTKVETLKISKEKMFAFFDDNKEIGYKVMIYLAKSCATHLRKADKDMMILFNALVDEIKE